MSSHGVTKILMLITNVEKQQKIIFRLFPFSFRWNALDTITLQLRGSNWVTSNNNNTPYFCCFWDHKSWFFIHAPHKFQDLKMERETSYHNLRLPEIALRMCLRQGGRGTRRRRRRVREWELKAGAVEVCMAAGSSPAIIWKLLNKLNFKDLNWIN